MKISIDKLFKPIRNPGFLKPLLITIPLLAGIIFPFINPSKLDAFDFLLIAWNPGQELLATGSIYANYPYPMWTVVVMMPFIILPAQTAMIGLYICNLVMLAVSLVLLVSLMDWMISAASFVLMMLLSVMFLPVLTSIYIGQLTIFSLFILLLTTHHFLYQRWTWLGIVLGLSFIKPQVMIVLAGLLLLWALWQRKWQIILGFGMVILLLMLISLPFVTNPGQIFGGGIASHLETYIQRTSTLWGLALSLGISWYFPLVISLALVIWLGLTWLPFMRSKEASTNRVVFLFSAAILVNLIVIPYSWMHNLVLLLLPICYCLNQAMKMKRAARISWLIYLFLIMYPLAIVLFIEFNTPNNTQAYQIIPAMLLLPTMWILEHKKTPTGMKNV